MMRQRTSGEHRGMLHFINRVDETNAGDRVASPLAHYLDYFSRFPLQRHDIRYIDWDAISSDDVVILGGGGIFDYAEFINRAIRRLLRTGAAVVGWSPGFNTHHEYLAPYRTEIDFDEFELLGVRDYENPMGLDYLPDVTCKIPQLRERHEIKREFGIARHKDYEIPHLQFDSITNESSVEDILTFIGESEVVISNSYHMIYWATLMGKKCVSPGGFSTKFAHFQYPPEFFDPGADDLSLVADRAQRYNVLEESIQQTDEFFEKAKRIISDRVAPISVEQNILAQVTDSALRYQRARATQLLAGDMVSSNVMIDTGDGFNPAVRLVAISNVYGDDVHRVRFDLSPYDGVQQIRFHPIEGWFCNVEIVSATSDMGSLELVPQGAVRMGDFDKFLSTDPRYLSTSPIGKSVEITFRLERTTDPNVDPITDYEGLIELREWERDHFQQEFQTTYQHLMGTSALLEDAQQQYEAAAARLREVEQSVSWRATAPLRTLRRRLGRGR